MYNFSVAGEEKKRRAVIRNQTDLPDKRVNIKKNKVCY